MEEKPICKTGKSLGNYNNPNLFKPYNIPNLQSVSVLHYTLDDEGKSEPIAWGHMTVTYIVNCHNLTDACEDVGALLRELGAAVPKDARTVKKRCRKNRTKKIFIILD